MGKGRKDKKDKDTGKGRGQKKKAATPEEKAKRRERSAHKEDHLNQWPEENMARMLDEWEAAKQLPKEDRPSMRSLSIKYHIPYETTR